MKFISMYSMRKKHREFKPAQFVKGYIKLKLEGVFIERFINICRTKNIMLWNIKSDLSTVFYVNMKMEDFKKIKDIAKSTRTLVKIKSKKGLPFIFHKHKKRKIFAVLLFVILLFILISSQFVWNVEIKGNETISSDELKQQLIQAGLDIGMYKNNINLYEVVRNMRNYREDLAWVGIDLYGTNAIVHIIEAETKPEIVNGDEYCNIISGKDGIITKISAQNGTPMVEVGDLVRTGDMLVAGWLEGLYTGIRYVHSLADVEARVWYSHKKSEPLNQMIKVETGEVEKKYSLKFNKIIINFYKMLTNFEKYDKIEEIKKIELFSNFYLPINIIETTNIEYEIQAINYEEKELKEKLLLEVREETLNEIKLAHPDVEDIDAIIINEQVNSKVANGFVEVEIIYEVIEKIGVQEKINFQEPLL